MIDQEYKFIFVHIPRTGGTSIEKLLFKGSNDYKEWLGYNSEYKLFAQHATIKQLKNELNVRVDDYFKFTIIRNPYERAVSDYFWLSKRKLSHPTSFKDYLLLRNGFEKLNHLRDETGRGDHFLTQFQFIEIEGKLEIDFIIRFENLQTDFNVVCDKIGIPKQQLPHDHKSKHKHYTEYYDEETKQIVAEKFSKDIEYFGYEFGK
jgi:hypothetical protein